MTRIIKVFPDYCSTGLWENHANIDVEQFEWLPPSLVIALKYWHFAWERAHDYMGCTWSGGKEYYEEWYEDGQEIVNNLDAYGYKFGVEFVYEADTPGKLFGG